MLNQHGVIEFLINSVQTFRLNTTFSVGDQSCPYFACRSPP